MAREILIVDSVATNRIVLKVKLAAAFYQVSQAVTGAEALERVRRSPPSLIILGGSNDMPAAQLCREFRKLSATENCPIIVQTTETGAEFRLEILAAGASAILEQPCCDALLLARLRSLSRAQETATELRMRESTHRALGLAEMQSSFDAPAKIGVMAVNRRGVAGRMAALRAIVPHRVDLLSPRDVFHNGPDTNGHNIVAPDALVVSLGDDDPEADLQILPNLRARASTRYSGILVLTSDPHGQVAAAALDLGADDVAPQQISVDEIALRTDRLVARKRMSDRLRSTVREGLRAAVTDPLTGLYNRRYALPHVARIAERAKRLGRPFALMVADLDHFKQVNDQFGHAAGDAVLAEVANRFRAQLRAVDLVARIGGEEFLIAMPDTSGTTAQSAAHRLRSAVADKPFYLPKHDLPIPITVSIGVTMAIPDTSPFADGDACHMTSDMRAETLLHRADGALYEAKAHGRNQVELSRPAA